MIEATLGKVAGGADLTMDEMSSAIDAIVEGRCPDQQIALLLTSLRMKGETVDEIAGAAASLRRHMTPIRNRHADAIDTCGTGGDGSATFNISTAAALVTAAAGVPVAKHGNRSVTSKSGSADVLRALGVNIEADVACVEDCLNELGICFCFAPLLHGSMKRVAEVRRKLGVPTIFNLLGPLANPAGAAFQLVGVAQDERRPQLAQALAMLGTTRAAVVCGSDPLDEVTLAGPTLVTVVGEGPPQEYTWQPADFGVEPSSLDSLTVDGPEASAAIIRNVLVGEKGPARDIVILNAAAALWTVRRADTLEQAARLAAEAIDSGAARDLLARLVERTNR